MVPYSRSRSLWWWNNILWKSVKYGAIFTVTEFVTVNQYIANFNMMQHCTTKQRQCLTVVQKITLTRINTIMQMITSEEQDMEWNNRIGKTSNQLCFSLQICAGSKKKLWRQWAEVQQNYTTVACHWNSDSHKTTRWPFIKFPCVFLTMETPTKIKHTSYC